MTLTSQTVFLIVAELSSTSVKDKDIQGPLLVCKTMHHIFHRVSFPITNGGVLGMKNMPDITVLNNLVMLNSNSFDLVPGP